MNFDCSACAGGERGVRRFEMIGTRILAPVFIVGLCGAGPSPGAKDVDSLMRALGNPNGRVRHGAIATLGEFGAAAKQAVLNTVPNTVASGATI